MHMPDITTYRPGTVMSGPATMKAYNPVNAASIGKDIWNFGASAINSIRAHPVQSAIIGGTVAAFAVGAIFTGGADLAAAPEVVGAETGAVAATDVGAAAAGIGDAGAAAADAADASAAAGDAADAGTAVSADTSASTSGIRAALGKLVSPAITAAKWGIIGTGVDIGLSQVSKGIANMSAAVFGTQPSIPYPNPNPFATGPSGSSPNTLGGASTGSVGSSGPSSLLTQMTSGTGLELLLLIGVVFIGYEAMKHSNNSGNK